ncbi:dihydroxyacetone kinase phosphoryl donor subunit DhaM [Isoptericola sp. b490]|uniref:dihydroxyacetone kinase phosphoryl donor subunit DhaM n=1 Tax=Actinotalea lenta TaxID=3064654 RepID=UPI00271353B8|nr:dihydroxyacetone kinase phosphoryl donor subunit DhaM [Isoptericola sp. b490]MDO8121024.1 dihydroxyacetone kinase phosphoryl donor subunit DhaM [Isoptericola sp. b490]
MSPRVALVLVSHSAQVADGTAQIAGQMAPDVLLLPAGGIDGDIGTSVDLVMESVERGLAECDDATGGVVVLTDLGSAVLTTDLVLEMVEPDRVRVPQAPFVEGAVSAAVAAQQGGDLTAVEAAALEAGSQYAAARPAQEAAASADGAVNATVTLRNPLGLHARTAAQVARAVADSGLTITVDGVDGSSVLALMALGATGGRELTLSASGDGAAAAVESLVALIDSGFGEV